MSRIRIDKRQRGSALVETAVGLILLIPVALFLLDVGAMVIVQTENDRLAKACARAAASASDSGTAQSNADAVYGKEKSASFINKSGTPKVTWALGGPNGDLVTVQTELICLLPCPVPLMGTPQVKFEAFSTEPIVGLLPTTGS